MVPAGAKAGSLVILRVPESSCIESWSESHVGEAVGYAPTSGERPDLGEPDEAFVQAPSSMEAGDTFQVRAPHTRPYAARARTGAGRGTGSSLPRMVVFEAEHLCLEHRVAVAIGVLSLGHTLRAAAPRT